LAKEDKNKKQKRKKKSKVVSFFIKFLTFIFALLIIFIPVCIGVIMYFNNSINSQNNAIIVSENDGIRRTDDGSFLFDVRRGETSQSVGSRLERTGFISNRYIWNLYCRFNSNHLKTGTYRIELPASMLSIHTLLVSGREVLHKVTIPEGVTIRKAAVIVEQAGICPSEEFLIAAKNPQIISDYKIPNDSMEGYLFPDTYFFPSAYPAELTIKKMADTFFSNLANINPSFINLSPQELNERVILASIVEREYRIADEAPLIAGVFNNRLQINMALQSCATVQYIITEILGQPHPRVLLFRDLEIRNPYNTYLYRGLPPGPISAPGVVALRAVMNPASTDYIYFRLLDASSGRHTFSRTYNEHMRAGDLYVKPEWP